MASNDLGGTVILYLRVVHFDYKSSSEGKVRKFRMDAPVATMVSELRGFMARQAQKSCNLIKLIFNNEVMDDSLTLLEHGIVNVAEISVLYDSSKDKKSKSRSQLEDAKSTGSKRKRNDDDMSVTSKRTKVDDSMSVSTAAPIREEDRIEREQPYCQKEVKPKQAFQGWTKRCIIQTGTLVGGKQQNEDSTFSFQSDDGRINSIGVFDGHGQYSFAAVCSKVSMKVTKTWFNKFAKEMPTWSPRMWKENFNQLFAKMHEVVRQQFVKMEKHIRHNANLDAHHGVVDKKGVIRRTDGYPIHGGTTVSVCVFVRNMDGKQYLVTAHVGDSDVVVAKEGTTVNFEVATEGHRALNRKEYARIQNLPDVHYPTKLQFVYDVQGVKEPQLLPKVYNKFGEMDSRIAKYPRLHGLYSSNIRKEPATYVVTPSKIKRDHVRLANTRAIGDFYAEQFGLSHVPDVTMEYLPSNESYFILAGSDGVWDTWEYHDVVNWIQQKANRETLKATHIEDFLDRTKQLSHDFYGKMAAVDDSSLCVIYAPKQS